MPSPSPSPVPSSLSLSPSPSLKHGSQTHRFCSDRLVISGKRSASQFFAHLSNKCLTLSPGDGGGEHPGVSYLSRSRKLGAPSLSASAWSSTASGIPSPTAEGNKRKHHHVHTSRHKANNAPFTFRLPLILHPSPINPCPRSLTIRVKVEVIRQACRGRRGNFRESGEGAFRGLTRKLKNHDPSKMSCKRGEGLD